MRATTRHQLFTFAATLNFVTHSYVTWHTCEIKKKTHGTLIFGMEIINIWTLIRALVCGWVFKCLKLIVCVTDAWFYSCGRFFNRFDYHNYYYTPIKDIYFNVRTLTFYCDNWCITEVTLLLFIHKL